MKLHRIIIISLLIPQLLIISSCEQSDLPFTPEDYHFYVSLYNRELSYRSVEGNGKPRRDHNETFERELGRFTLPNIPIDLTNAIQYYLPNSQSPIQLETSSIDYSKEMGSVSIVLDPVYGQKKYYHMNKNDSQSINLSYSNNADVDMYVFLLEDFVQGTGSIELVICSESFSDTLIVSTNNNLVLTPNNIQISPIDLSNIEEDLAFRLNIGRSLWRDNVYCLYLFSNYEPGTYWFRGITESSLGYYDFSGVNTNFQFYAYLLEL